jgi:hypothetical protein
LQNASRTSHKSIFHAISGPANAILEFGESYYMIANLQSARPGHIVDDTISLRQRLEYFERHIQNKSQEVKNGYAQALYKTIEAEKSIRHFANVFNDR